MSLGYTYVECPFGHLFHHNVHRASTWHGRCHSNYLGVLFCQFKQCMSEYILIFLRLCGVVVHNALACVWIEFSRCVPCRHILLCRCISVSFLSVKMQQFRSCHILQLTQYAHQFLHVVSVKGTEVLYVHTVEDVLLMRNRTLHRICQSDKSLLAVIIQHAMAIEPSCRLKLYGVICLVGAQVQQILLHTSHTSVYRHIVVVQDDKQVVRAARYVVQSFKCQSAAQSFFPSSSAATAMPNAADTELLACPQAKVSYSLSSGDGNGLMPPSFLFVQNFSFLPVSILCP